MALDHYISQIHLKQFNSPALGDLFHAIRKRDLFYFTPNSKSVCRIEDGSTNAYLSKDRAIEDFLKTIEPRYSSAITALKELRLDSDSIYVIAGFAAYVLTCSPAAMRHQSTPLKSIVEVTAKMYDAKGLLPKAPDELGNKSLSELLESNELKINIDEKYPQAIGITSVINLTSDFPIATIRTPHGIAIRLMPLSPTLAVSIFPLRTSPAAEPDLEFRRNKSRSREITRQQAIEINQTLVRAAESEVYFRDNFPWVAGFVKKNADYRTEVVAEAIPSGTGTLLHTLTEIRSYHVPRSS